MSSGESSETLEYTATWIVALVCAIIIIVSLFAERFLHYLGKFLKHKRLDALFQALEKLKEELMLLGFISLLLSVFQSFITTICIPEDASFHMLPCEKDNSVPVEVMHHLISNDIIWKRQRSLSGTIATDHCSHKGKVQLLSLEALHQLHIFIFVLAVVHVVFCATTMILGGARIRQWKLWEKEIHTEISNPENTTTTEQQKYAHESITHSHHEFVQNRAVGNWTKSAVISRAVSCSCFVIIHVFLSLLLAIYILFCYYLFIILQEMILQVLEKVRTY
ncbi:hypothetical protein HPP92_026834 [Vanilla planifolia]|uniref:MLO-like protein n=1 Tax=Vanilla planifolia TaxID=51239 RepID=A0A835U6E9_VANPL|nr:hypothetical protein HPP92_026834 [Vanilla planifolia]